MTDPIYVGLINRVRLAGGVPRYVPLIASALGWRLDVDALAAIDPRPVKSVLMMSPSMPTGAVFDREEWQALTAFSPACRLLVAQRNAIGVERRALACPSQTLGSVDVPADGATVSGYVQVKGYALDGNQVSNVDVYLDGTDDANRVTTAGGANINLPRPDVLLAYPQYAGTPGQYPGLQASFKAANSW